MPPKTALRCCGWRSAFWPPPASVSASGRFAAARPSVRRDGHALRWAALSGRLGCLLGLERRMRSVARGRSAHSHGYHPSALVLREYYGRALSAPFSPDFRKSSGEVLGIGLRVGRFVGGLGGWFVSWFCLDLDVLAYPAHRLTPKRKHYRSVCQHVGGLVCRFDFGWRAASGAGESVRIRARRVGGLGSPDSRAARAAAGVADGGGSCAAVRLCGKIAARSDAAAERAAHGGAK